MARNKQPTPLARSLNAELAAGMNTTQAMSNSAISKTPREMLGDLVTRMNAEQGRDWGTGTDWKAKAEGLDKTQAYNKGKTTAYPVPKTMSMRMTGKTTIASEKASEREAQSPVRLKGNRGNSRGSGAGHKGGSLVHSTIRAMELLGEHEGNNKKVIESLVNK